MRHKLTATEVKTIKEPGRYNDGGSLYFLVRNQRDSLTKSWVFRYRNRVDGKLRDMGIGSFPDTGLAEARDRAKAHRKVLEAGMDPMAERQREDAEKRAALGKTKTFDQCAELYIAAQEPSWTNPKHVAQWRNTLRTYASPVIGKLPVNLVSAELVLKVIQPIWTEKPETASRVRQRIERVLDWAASPTRKYRDGENPARWGTLRHELAEVKTKQPHPSLPYLGMFTFMDDLAERETVTARALEFTILTGLRTSEVLGAQWSEIDFDSAVWTVPSSRMKVSKFKDGTPRPPHRVPLSEAAIEVLESLQGLDETYIFPGASDDTHLSNTAMLELVKDMHAESIKNGGKGYIDPNRDNRRIVPHGFRASFTTWAEELTDTPSLVISFAKAHVTKGLLKAYMRGDMFAKRTVLMEAWATYCYTKPAKGKVVPIKAAGGIQ